MQRKNLLKAVLVLGMVLALWPLGRPVQAAPYTVANTNDSGAGSLRQAIINANAAGADIIDFNIPMTDSGCNAGTGVCTIQPASELPALTDDGTVIGGYSQPGAAPATDTTPAVLKIELDGSKVGAGASGLSIRSADNVIAGLVINRFGEHGIQISGSGATGNAIVGNYIGTDANGTVAQGNTFSGISIWGGSQSNTIGGDTPAERNVISGNNENGVLIHNGAQNNTVSGNYIGTDVNGTAVLSNTYSGVGISGGAQNNTIGGDRNADEGNVISGNNEHGVLISGSDTMSNTVLGNYIGTDASGTSDLGNTSNGVWIGNGAQNNTIGGNTAGERNVISGNEGGGVIIRDSDTMSNTVSGNYIGTDASGTLDRGNTGSGVFIGSGAQSNTIAQNVISGNNFHSIEIGGSTTMSNTVLGNYIGTDESGTLDLGNTHSGVLIYGGAHNNTIGGNTAGERNIISGNSGNGIWITDSDGNTALGNYIGTDVSGTLDLGNDEHGVSICGDAQSNTVGPDNVIAHNGEDGVDVQEDSPSGNIFTQNSIFSNTMGIDLWPGANGGIAAPTILTTTVGSVNIGGYVSACPSCTVEVFENSDTDGEGETYVGYTIADGSGHFTVTVSSLTKPYLTATATDVVSGTSEFSDVFTATVELSPPVGPVYLPIILKSH